ncbi:hypothetical protein [Paraburkholderia dinghuensis]|uniref:hypothetical protein n=1 Tax=Paraburkholderia dinghuensis TaxID=2305225 RepID=UPI001623CF59|nr:hypothetical protein [Paraburkholderia dinghuensis]
MSNIALTLVRGARKTDGIYEIGERTLRSLAARIIAGEYNGEAFTVDASRGI